MPNGGMPVPENILLQKSTGQLSVLSVVKKKKSIAISMGVRT